MILVIGGVVVEPLDTLEAAFLDVGKRRSVADYAARLAHDHH